MNIYQRLINLLEQLVIKGPKQIDAVIQEAPRRGYLIGLPAEGKGAGASLSLADYDRYSIILGHLEIYDDSLVIDANDREAYLHRCAAEIAKRLTYLEEPLALIEVDAIEGLAQLRSDPAQLSPKEAIYWEVVVKLEPHPHLRLTRYRWTAGNYGRSALPHPVTFVTLGRIAEDLAASLIE